MRISLAFGAWLDHEPVWLPPEEADAALAALRDELSGSSVKSSCLGGGSFSLA
jgi:hypothetical protein